jgi:hypothetical protein
MCHGGEQHRLCYSKKRFKCTQCEEVFTIQQVGVMTVEHGMDPLGLYPFEWRDEWNYCVPYADLEFVKIGKPNCTDSVPVSGKPSSKPSSKKSRSQKPNKSVQPVTSKGCWHLTSSIVGGTRKCTSCGTPLVKKKGKCMHDDLPRNPNRVRVMCPHCLLFEKCPTETDGIIHDKDDKCVFAWDPANPFATSVQCENCTQECMHLDKDTTGMCTRCHDPTACIHQNMDTTTGTCRECGYVNEHMAVDKDYGNQCPTFTHHQPVITASEGDKLYGQMEIDESAAKGEGDAVDSSQLETQKFGGDNEQDSPVVQPVEPGPIVPPARCCCVCGFVFLGTSVQISVHGSSFCVCMLHALLKPLDECCGVPADTDIDLFEVVIRMTPDDVQPPVNQGLQRIMDMVVDTLKYRGDLVRLTTNAFSVYVKRENQPYPPKEALLWYTAVCSEACLMMADGRVHMWAATEHIKSLDGWSAVGFNVLVAWEDLMRECAIVGATKGVREVALPYLDTEAVAIQVNKDFADARDALRCYLTEQWKKDVEWNKSVRVKDCKKRFPARSEYEGRLQKITKETDEKLARGPDDETLAEFEDKVAEELNFQKSLLLCPCFCLLHGMNSCSDQYWQGDKHLVRNAEGAVRWDVMLSAAGIVIHEIAADHVGEQGRGLKTGNKQIMRLVAMMVAKACSACNIPRVTVVCMNDASTKDLDKPHPIDPFNAVLIACDVHNRWANITGILRALAQTMAGHLVQGPPVDGIVPPYPSPAAVCESPCLSSVTFECLVGFEKGDCNPQLAGLAELMSIMLSNVTNFSVRIPGLRTMRVYDLMVEIHAAAEHHTNKEKEVRRLSDLVRFFVTWVWNATMAVIIGSVVNVSVGSEMRSVVVKHISDYAVDDYSRLMDDPVFNKIMNAAFDDSDAMQEGVVYEKRQ